MPIYTYRCENCGIQFDKQQHFDDPVLKVCPECGESSLRKVYLPVGIVFKGSGFYATDHRSPSGMNYSKKSNDDKSDTNKNSATNKKSEDTK